MNANMNIRSRAHTTPRMMICPMLLCAAACLTACGVGGGNSVADTTQPPPLLAVQAVPDADDKIDKIDNSRECNIEQTILDACIFV